MIGLRLRVAIATTCFLVGSMPAARAAEDPHIARIEADLEPVIQPRNGPVVRHTLAEEMAAHHLPALSIAVADGGRIVWAKAYGLADVADAVAATTGTVFQAGSISKPVAASAAMQLIQEGKLRLDTPANDQLKSWRIPDSAFTGDQPVTLRHLLTHTGGLTVHGFPGYAAGVPVPTVAQVLAGKPPANTPAVLVERRPGTVWNYSGGGITIAQLMMTDVTGQPFPVLLRERVFKPLGMSASTYEQPLPASRRDGAAGYLADGMPVAGRFHTYPEMAAAGLWTTPSDLVRWAIALQRANDGQSARLMSQASAKAMLTPGLGSWGLGIMINGAPGPAEGMRFSHGGDDWGFKAQLVGYMTGGRVIAVMANGDDGDVVNQELLAAVARAYGWKGFEPHLVDTVTISAAERAEITGRYAKGSMTITEAGPFFELRVGPLRITLVPQGSDQFMPTEAMPLVKAVRGADGAITAIAIGPARYLKDK